MLNETPAVCANGVPEIPPVDNWQFCRTDTVVYQGLPVTPGGNINNLYGVEGTTGIPPV
jgi:hypothetical protein